MSDGKKGKRKNAGLKPVKNVNNCSRGLRLELPALKHFR